MILFKGNSTDFYQIIFLGWTILKDKPYYWYLNLGTHYQCDLLKLYNRNKKKVFLLLLFENNQKILQLQLANLKLIIVPAIVSSVF